MVFLKATWSHDYLEILLQPSIHLFVQLLPQSFFDDGRRLSDTYCSDKLSSIFSCFFERADALLGLKAGVQPQPKIPHYLLSNSKTRDKVLQLMLRIIISHLTEASVILKYDTVCNYISSMTNDEFLLLYAKCYTAILEEKIGRQQILVFDPHMPVELKRLLAEACNKFKISSYFMPSSMTIVGAHSFPIHADELYYHDEDCDIAQKKDDESQISCDNQSGIFISAIPIVLCAPWFPSGDDKLRKVIVQPRRGRLQDNLAISRISFRVLGFMDDQYFVHMLRSPPSYDTMEQKQLVTEAKGSKPTASEVVPLIGSRVIFSFDNCADTQSFITTLNALSPEKSTSTLIQSDGQASSAPVDSDSSCLSVCLEVAFISLQWLLDSLNYNELCDLSDYTEQNITYIPIASLEESVNTAATTTTTVAGTTAFTHSSDTSCKYYECYCGGCRFIFRDAEYTSPDLSYFYISMRSNLRKYESSLNLLKKNIGYTSKAITSHSGTLSIDDKDAVHYNYDHINVTLSFGMLLAKDMPNDKRILSFHGTILTRDVVEILFSPASDPSKWKNENLSQSTLLEDLKDTLVVNQPIDNMTKIGQGSAHQPMIFTNPHLSGRKCDVLKEEFLLTAFTYIYNDNFDSETERILLSIIRCSDNQLELRKYLKIPDEQGNLIPVSQIMDEFKFHRYKYLPIIDTFLFGSQFTGIADDGRVYGYTGSGLVAAKQVLDGELASILDYPNPAPHPHSDYASLVQVTPNKWFKDVTIMYPLEKEHFAPELSNGKLRESDYILFRNTIIHHYLTTQKRPFKCFVLYDILPIAVDTIHKLYNFMTNEGLINYNTESAMPLSSLIFMPGAGSHCSIRDIGAKEVSLNLNSLAISGENASGDQQVHREVITRYSETKITNPILQHHALLGATVHRTDEQINDMINDAILYMEKNRTPLGLASLGARQLINALEDVLTEVCS